MSAVALRALQHYQGNSTSQKGKPLDIWNSEFARDPTAMMIFMRENNRSTLQGDS